MKKLAFYAHVELLLKEKYNLGHLIENEIDIETYDQYYGTHTAKKAASDIAKEFRTYIVKDIKYDTDGQRGLNLPKKMVITVPTEVGDDKQEIDEYLSDEISNKTGFCHLGFTIESEN